MQRIVRKYYKQLYNNKLDNLDEMDKFIETHSLPKLNQEQSENLDRPITTNEIEAIFKNLPTKKGPRPNSFTGKFCQTFKEELTPILLKLLQKTKRRKDSQTHFLRENINIKTDQEQNRDVCFYHSYST